MNVVVRGMTLPEYCIECPLGRDRNKCPQLGQDIRKVGGYKRLLDCPLEEIPDGQGDLVGRDAVKKHITDRNAQVKAFGTVGEILISGWIDDVRPVIRG